RNPRPAANAPRRLHGSLQLRSKAKVPRRSHALRIHLQDLDIRARQIHPEPDPPNAGTEHLEHRSLRRTLLGRVGEEIRDLLGIDGDLPEDAENLKVAVTLSFDRRRGGVVEAESLQELAERLVRDDDDQGFRIITT